MWSSATFGFTTSAYAWRWAHHGSLIGSLPSHAGMTVWEDAWSPSRGGHLPLIFLSGSDPMIFHLHTSSPALANPILLFRLCCLLFAKRRMLLMQRHCVVVPERPGCFCCLLGNASSGTQPPRPGFTIVSLPACTRTCLSSRLVALRGGGQLIPPPQEN